ncbi:MAG: hypothetical protein CMJ19_24710 [Phycisphaeraceae bacterium]|nr:hypothetical protein [Phycisphaeraceae bacterium]
MPTSTRTYCNPLNLPYRFQTPDRAPELYREAADPSVVVFDDCYWLFASKSGGYWYSTDLLDWVFVKSTALPVDDYAPDVRVIRGWLYFTASDNQKPCAIYRTQNPKADQWEKVSAPFAYWDPNLFEDEDGQVYLYWGCNNRVPIQGVKMDPQTMLPIGEPVELLGGMPDQHGFERCGEDHCLPNQAPFIEGAWMTKHNGRYYLQYAGPGTEWNVYADGVYESDSPLGPFTYAANNPYSYKPGGFIPGAGHGSTFEDTHGNLWHISTMRISVKHAFERRIGLFPAGFDDDGMLYCNTRFADYPTHIPNSQWDAMADPFTGWMLLSYDKPVTASSTRQGHPPELAVNENIQNGWSATDDDQTPWLMVDLKHHCDIHAIQINFAEQDCQWDAVMQGDLAHQYLLEISDDGQRWQSLSDKQDNTLDQPHDYLTWDTPHRGRYVRIQSKHTAAAGKFAISGLRVFGKADVALPEQVQTITVQRDNLGMDAQLTWQADEKATGYNVLWGIAADKLYQCHTVYNQSDVKLGALDKGKNYWLRIDSFNEAGVTEGSINLMF